MRVIQYISFFIFNCQDYIEMLHSASKRIRFALYIGSALRIIFTSFLAWVMIANFPSYEESAIESTILGWMIAAIITLGAVLMIIVLSSKCDSCHKLCMASWDQNYKEPYWAKSLFGKIRDFFFPPELKIGKFKCVRCGDESEI